MISAILGFIGVLSVFLVFPLLSAWFDFCQKQFKPDFEIAFAIGVPTALFTAFLILLTN